MAQKGSIRTILILWLSWGLLLIGYQKVVAARLDLRVPDTVLDWTASETTPGAHASQPYLLEPFMNQQVAYDSEFYLSIDRHSGIQRSRPARGLGGSKNPQLIWIRYPQAFGIASDFAEGRPYGIPASYQAYSLNYAFFLLFPLAIRALSYPLKLIDLNPIATATLAGVIVSLLGALGAMLALYDLTRDELGNSGGIRTAFYLIAFPTGFFLAMVHTEGLFVGLAFGSLALLRRRQWIGAATLAAGATLTRAVGGSLIIPFGLAWAAETLPYVRNRWIGRKAKSATTAQPRWDLLWKGVLALSPLLAFGLWYWLLGTQFRIVEAAFFGRGALAVARSWQAWVDVFRSLFSAGRQSIATNIGCGMIVLTALLSTRAFFRQWLAKTLPGSVLTAGNLLLLGFGAAIVYSWWTGTINPQRSFYYMVEFSATMLAITACAFTLRSQPSLALFSLAVVVISFFSGGAQGMHRYILGAPAVFVMLGHLGKSNEAFDRSWTIGSVLLMGLFALLFAFNFWVG